MLAEPIVEELILAGPTPPAAAAKFLMAIRKEEQQSIYRHVVGGQCYEYGNTLRIAPPLRVAERFRAFVTWLPR